MWTFYRDDGALLRISEIGVMPCGLVCATAYV